MKLPHPQQGLQRLGAQTPARRGLRCLLRLSVRSDLSADQGPLMSKVAKAVIWFALAVAVGITINYALDIERRLKADECERSRSPGGQYLAERCLVQWRGPDDSDYVGRVYDARSGTLLVERSFNTPVPELFWWKSEAVSFSRGGDESSTVCLPPTAYDRFNALLPSLLSSRGGVSRLAN